MKISTLDKISGLMVALLLTISIFCFWSVSQRIEDAGGIKQVVIDAGREIKDIGIEIAKD